MSVRSDIPAPRWTVRAPVSLLAMPQSPRWRTLNVSASGMFLTGPMLLEAGTELDVVVALPVAFGETLDLKCRVEVVWKRDPADASPSRPSGMGVRFLRVDPRAIAKYLGALAAYRNKKNPPPAPVNPSSAITVIPTASPAPMPPPRQLQPGEQLGRYTIVNRLGQGGTGDVYLAEHTSLGRRVALKRLQEQHLQDRSAVRRFYDEARLVNQIQHDNIVQITDLVVSDAHTFIVMELLAGRTLEQELAPRSPLALSRIRSIGAQLCAALAAVHRAGIVHRDLKPGNIMLVNRRSTPDFVKLLDFGIAKLRDESHEGPRGPEQVIGTPGFMAPEQLLGQPVDALADVYSLGVVLFAMLTGQTPFTAPTPMEVMLRQVRENPIAPSTMTTHPIPAALEAAVLRCLERDPTKRPPHISAVADALNVS